MGTESATRRHSRVVDSSTYDSQGFCNGFELRRHNHEVEANKGSRQARSDWIRCIGPIDKFGNCNPYSGHLVALAFPLCMPTRLRLVSYIFEFVSIYDQHLDSAENSVLRNYGEVSGLDEVELRGIKSTRDTKQLQSKMQLALLKTDLACARVAIGAWRAMLIGTAERDKERIFDNLEEYIECRIVDVGARFLDTFMRFGMGLVLTKEEERATYPIAYECYAAIGLINDYFSFDEEWKYFQKSGKRTLTNAVWLFTQWHHVDIVTAKAMVRTTVNRIEQRFLQLKEDFLREHPEDEKLRNYLRGLAYQMSGNVAWSLTCPRYCAEARYDPNIGADMPDQPIIEQGVTSDETNVALHPSKHGRTSSSGTVSSITSTFSDAESEASSLYLSLSIDI